MRQLKKKTRAGRSTFHSNKTLAEAMCQRSAVEIQKWKQKTILKFRTNIGNLTRLQNSAYQERIGIFQRGIGEVLKISTVGRCVVSLAALLVQAWSLICRWLCFLFLV